MIWEKENRISILLKFIFLAAKLGHCAQNLASFKIPSFSPFCFWCVFCILNFWLASLMLDSSSPWLHAKIPIKKNTALVLTGRYHTSSSHMKTIVMRWPKTNIKMERSIAVATKTKYFTLRNSRTAGEEVPPWRMISQDAGKMQRITCKNFPKEERKTGSYNWK